MGESLKESLEAAFDEDVGSSEVVDTPPVDEISPVVDEPVVDKPASTEEPPGGEGVVDEGAGSPARESDESADIAAKQEESKGESQEEPPATRLKPPASWKPAMREKFSALPDDIQGEILRREVDMSRGMELIADARRFKQDFENKVAPYQAEFASRNVSAMDAFDNYLSTAYKLRHAPPQEKAALVGGLINQYGVSIEMLDQVLVNQQQAPGPTNGAPQGDPNVTYAVQQALAPYQQFMNGMQQQQIQSVEQTQTEIRDEITTFSQDTANEYYEDVKLEMATFLEAAAQRNQQMTLQEAYDRAILLRPELAEVVARRKLQNEAETRDKAAKAAQAKAVGVAGSSPDLGGGRAQPQSLRGAIEAAIDSTD
jgi:hypothetical protein